MFICSYLRVCLCVVLHVGASMCVNLLTQWCEAASLWLCVQQHTQRRQNYTRFKCRFGHLAAMVQNGATMGGTLALNCTCLLLPAVTFLRTKYNTCKCGTLFYYQSVNMCFFYFFDCGYSCMWQKTCHCGLCASRFTCIFVDVRVSKFGWAADKRVELRAQGPADLSWTSSFFFF